MDPKIFKAYDIRGIYPDQFNEDDAYKIAQAYATYIKPKNIVLGHDVRSSGNKLWQAAANGFLDAGVDVIDVGTISTDMLYFSVANYGYDGGITISASHNPREYNGMKMVREKSIAISSDTGLNEIRDLTINKTKLSSENKGKIIKKDILNDYINHILKFIDIRKIKPLKIVLSANFGLAGKVAEKIISKIPAKIEHECLDCVPDGDFPKGLPDPLIPERRTETSELVKNSHADLGVAWDADADRCFFFDENGNFIEGYYIVGILAKELLKNHPGDKILHDPRLVWATIETVKAAGGVPIITKTGHGFIKDRMRKENALFSGEMSAHYYFRDNWYADNGMIPFVTMLEILSQSKQKLSELVQPMIEKYPVSGEINNEVKDVKAVLEEAEKIYHDGKIDKIDGLSVEYPQWRFSLRGSNTEPKIRLNVETRGDRKLMEQKRDELIALIEKYK